MEKLFKNILLYTMAIAHFVTYSTQGLAAISPVSNSFEEKKTLIQSVDANDVDFNKFIEKNPQFESLESKRPLVANRALSQMYSLKQLAEAEFMGADTNKAYELYKSLVQMALGQDWEESERQVIFTAFFRMAQIKPEEATKWIQKAINFDNKATPNEDLISATLIEKFLAQKEILAKEQISLSLDVPSTYYINGIKNLKEVHPEAMYRISYVSNVYGVKTELAKGNMLQDIFPFTTPLVQGHCQKQVSINPLTYNQVQASLQESFVFSSTQCAPKVLTSVALLKVVPDKEEAQLANQLPSKQVKSETMNLNLYPSSIDTAALTKEDNFNFNNKQEVKSSRKKWIIILSSVAAVTLGAFLIHKNNEKGDARSPQPAQSQDF